MSQTEIVLYSYRRSIGAKGGYIYSELKKCRDGKVHYNKVQREGWFKGVICKNYTSTEEALSLIGSIFDAYNVLECCDAPLAACSVYMTVFKHTFVLADGRKIVLDNRHKLPEKFGSMLKELEIILDVCEADETRFISALKRVPSVFDVDL